MTDARSRKSDSHFTPYNPRFRRPNAALKLALFDLDHTLLPIDSADTWSHFLVRAAASIPGLHRAHRAFREDYRAGTFDVEAYLRFQMELLAGFPREQLDAWHDEFMRAHVSDHVRREARRLIDSHRRAATNWRWSPAPRLRHPPIAAGCASTTCWPSPRERCRRRVHRRRHRHAHVPGRQGAQGRGMAGRSRPFARQYRHDLLFGFDQRSAAARARHRSRRHQRRRAIAGDCAQRGWPTLQLFEPPPMLSEAWPTPIA